MVALVQGGRHDVDPALVDVPRASPRDAAVALASLVDGVESRDAASLAALAPGGDAGVRDELAGIADTAAALDLRAVTARYVDQVGTVANRHLVQQDMGRGGLQIVQRLGQRTVEIL